MHTRVWFTCYRNDVASFSRLKRGMARCYPPESSLKLKTSRRVDWHTAELSRPQSNFHRSFHWREDRNFPVLARGDRARASFALNNGCSNFDLQACSVFLCLSYRMSYGEPVGLDKCQAVQGYLGLTSQRGWGCTAVFSDSRTNFASEVKLDVATLAMPPSRRTNVRRGRKEACTRRYSAWLVSNILLACCNALRKYPDGPFVARDMYYRYSARAYRKMYSM